MAELVQDLGSFVPDNLIVDGSVPILTKAVKLDAGQGTLTRGTVLGKITKAVGEIVGPGTAKGTIGTVVLGKGVKLGTYKLICTTATGSGVKAVFKAIDPEGIRLDDAVADTAYSGPISFTITEASGFALGDTFVIPVIAASGKYKAVNSANTDGSENADCILADDVDTTESVVAVAYTSGHFNRKALVFGGSDTADTHEARLRELGIFLSDNVSYFRKESDIDGNKSL